MAAAAKARGWSRLSRDNGARGACEPVALHVGPGRKAERVSLSGAATATSGSGSIYPTTTHPPDIADYRREQNREVVEATASGVRSVGGAVSVIQLGLAKAELIRRDREHAEQQERSRRDFEFALADKQLSAATDAAKATRLAMWAALTAAVGAIVQAGMAVACYYKWKIPAGGHREARTIGVVCSIPAGLSRHPGRNPSGGRSSPG
jgi:hypothetical protein